MSERLDPYGPRRPGESLHAYQHRTLSRERYRSRTEPESFWMSVLLEYIQDNPGCSQIEAARSLHPHRSEALGKKLISVAERTGKIDIIVRPGRSTQHFLRDQPDQSMDTSF